MAQLTERLPTVQRASHRISSTVQKYVPTYYNPRNQEVGAGCKFRVFLCYIESPGSACLHETLSKKQKEKPDVIGDRSWCGSGHTAPI